MFWRHKAATVNNWELLENIKIDIENRLSEKGVMISGINIEMNSENISLSIHIQSLPATRHSNTN